MDLDHVKREPAGRDQHAMAGGVRYQKRWFGGALDFVGMARLLAAGVVGLDSQLAGNHSGDQKPTIDRCNGRMIVEDLLFDGQRPFVEQAITIIVLAVANLGRGPDRAVANEAHAIFGADVSPLNALAGTAPAGLAKLWPIFIDLHVAVVVCPVAGLDTGPRPPCGVRLYLLASSFNVAQRLRASHLATASEGQQPDGGQDCPGARSGARKGMALDAAPMCLQES